ncbi:hypothetical protein [Paenibacillus sp. sgz5001063]|uniref:hypothetical protein n=1 Tax=Paenibacillus sp. sgz5001063 TaxID=3242474 RepID=UPI0036D2C9C8
MRVVIGRKEFNSLTDERLGWACMESTFKLIRGKSPEVKVAAINQLGKAQTALCMFRIMYDHCHKSSAEFYAWSSYLLNQQGTWNGVLEGVRFFADDALFELLEETRERLEARNLSLGLGWEDAGLNDIETDPELLEIVNGLYERFKRLKPNTHNVIAEYIRAHPDEFVEFSK